MTDTELKKIVFKDTDCTKVLFGHILEESEHFLKVKTTRGYIFEINKNNIIFTREDGNDY
jgi:hypothetical protein